MPIYEYSCKCGYNFELLKPIKERQYAKCPKCGLMAEKKISTFDFGFVDKNRPSGLRLGNDHFGE